MELAIVIIIYLTGVAIFTGIMAVKYNDDIADFLHLTLIWPAVLIVGILMSPALIARYLKGRRDEKRREADRS